MPVLDLSVDELFNTTRAVRKRLDFEKTVEIDVIRECLQLALQAPNGSNSQNWHFLIVTELSKKKLLSSTAKYGKNIPSLRKRQTVFIRMIQY